MYIIYIRNIYTYKYIYINVNLNYIDAVNSSLSKTPNYPILILDLSITTFMATVQNSFPLTNK